MNRILLTTDALSKVEADLDELIVKRKEISEEIKKARAFGDLSENAEYHAAREAQSQNETEIMKLKNIIDNHELVSEEEFSKDRVHINSNVVVLFVEDNENEELTIVTQVESDPLESKISNESPIGSVLIGKEVGDTVVATTPNGPVTIKLLEIKN